MRAFEHSSIAEQYCGEMAVLKLFRNLKNPYIKDFSNSKIVPQTAQFYVVLAV